MKPIKFPGYNCVYAENQEDYLPLPAYKHGDEYGSISSCWKLSIKERLKVLWTGKVYTTLLSFNKPLTPQRVGVNNPTEEGE